MPVVEASSHFQSECNIDGRAEIGCVGVATLTFVVFVRPQNSRGGPDCVGSGSVCKTANNHDDLSGLADENFFPAGATVRGMGNRLHTEHRCPFHPALQWILWCLRA